MRLEHDLYKRECREFRLSTISINCKVHCISNLKLNQILHNHSEFKLFHDVLRLLKNHKGIKRKLGSLISIFRYSDQSKNLLHTWKWERYTFTTIELDVMASLRLDLFCSSETVRSSICLVIREPRQRNLIYDELIGFLPRQLRWFADWSDQCWNTENWIMM